jgi:hypothetical protein
VGLLYVSVFVERAEVAVTGEKVLVINVDPLARTDASAV